MKHAHGFLAVTSSETTATGSGKAKHRRGQWGRRAFRATAIAAVAAVISTGAIAAVAAPTDSSNASARFLSGTLLTSAGTLDSLAALEGSSATNSGSPTADTQTSDLDLSVVGGSLTVDIPGGVTIPLSQFLQLGLVNQYAQASDNGVSRAASGAVSNGGIVDLSGTGAFPADAQIDVVDLLGAPANGVLDTANVKLGAVTGVAALDAAVPGGPATSCADLSNPTNCRDYNIANASLNLHSPLVSQVVGSINTTLDATSATVNGLSSALTGSVTGIVNGLLLGAGTSDLNVSVNANLKSALSAVLSGSLSQGGVTLDLATGTITANLDTIIGGLNNQAPNTPLLSAAVINAVVGDLGTILTTLQANINTALQTALNNVPVTITGGVCLATGCDPGTLGLGGKLSLAYSGTLGDLVAGTTAIQATGTGAVSALLAPVINTLSSTISTALGLLITPVLTTALSTVATAVTTAVTSAAVALAPVLTSIGSVIGITLNVQEPGTAAGSYREVAARVSLLSGAGATVDLGRAEVGPNVVNAAVAPTIASLTPTHGPEAGGTVVTITGTGFTGATGVTFDGTPGTTFTVDSDTQITVTTPAHAPGATDVVVQSPNGNSAPGTFTFDPAATAPTITTLAPDHGPVTGGTAVTITGTGFTGATGVTFDGTSGTSFTVDSDTQITVTSPAHPVGPVDVVVQSPNGTSAPGTFTYNPVTTVTAVTPNSGPEAGGTNVLITGSCFAGATAVMFGGVAATSFLVINDTTISAVVPAGTGLVDVSVTGAGDCGTGTLPDAYTYLPAAAISGLSPDHGPEAGGTVVTITGTGFTGATGATFDGLDGTSFTVDSDTQITVTSPAHAPGATDVVVQSPNGDSAPGTFTFDAAPAAPTITALAPDHGPVTGGTVVTITGTGFTGATGVTFDGTPGTAFVVDSDTQITVTSPAHAAGPADVVVLSPNGNSAPGTFTFDAAPAAPTITALAPDHGPVTGGTVVTITGTGFTGATGVTFDGTPGTAFVVDSDTQITVTSPAHAAGPADVVVLSPNGNSAPGTFTFDAAPAAPTITALAPDHGPVTGGTVVTITGTGFTGATGVTFDGTSGTAFVVDSDTQITVTSPAHPVGTVNVVVQSPNGDSTPGAFTYNPVTVVTAVFPNSGPEAGGTNVLITGSCFAGATAVTFGGVAATSFMIIDDADISAVVPAGTGLVDVSVTGAGDCGTGTLPGAYTYLPAPVISGLSPDHGPAAGGTIVTITGTGFYPGSSVTFDGQPATSLVVDSDTQITAATPAHTPGPVDVVVSGIGGDSAPLTYTYDPITTIDGVDPGSGPEAGGTSVTITGQCFTGATGVLFGTTPATSFTVVSDTEITAVAPAGTGTVDVTVVGAANCGTATDPGGYEYVPTPVILGIAPQQGPETGGTAVTVTGTGFTSATGVTFDGVAGTDFTVVSDTQITVTTPAHAPGAVNVVVADPLRNSDPGTFTYTPVTAIDGVNPGEGPEDGGTTVTITGQCFTGATGVLFGTTPATSFTVVSDTEITAVSPAGLGTVDVTVTGAQGCGNATDPGGFTYVPDTTPIIYGLTPTRGPEAGGTVVTITGANFTGATDATFDGTKGTSFTVDSDTQITVTSPAHAASTVNVVVHGPDNIGSNAGAFTYFAVADIGGVDPGTGPTDGGTTVTITGKCFTGATGVLFGTTPAKSFTVVNDTTIRAVTPAGTGKVDVTVVGAGDCGSATLPHGFEYITAAAALARTGVDVLAGTWMSAFALMLAGLVLVAIRRRRSAE